MLKCEELHKQFGGLIAVDRLNLTVRKGEMVGLIGPNGAGKTTVFNLITGFLKTTSGHVWYEQTEITNLPPNVIASLGLVRTFQRVNIFSGLTVLDSVLIGSHLNLESGFLGSIVQSAKKRLEEKVAREKALDILETVGLSHLGYQQSRNLPIGFQRALGIAVALASGPKLLLLDEASSGMNIREKEHIMDVISRVHGRGTTVLLIEHDMKFVMGLCHRIVVLDSGAVIAEGSPGEIQNNERVVDIYLGKGYRK